jgi:proline iminopeptidase
MQIHFLPGQATPREGYLPVDQAQIYYRDIGQGQPIIVIHGGPDFDHNYLLPDLDRLSDSFRLIYYDQRGRGRSVENVQPEDVTIGSEIEDLETLRKYFQLESVPVLGHSWGGLLAMEYAIRHPIRVSHLILMNTAPASHDDFIVLQQHRRERPVADIAALKTCSSSAEYQNGDPDTVAEYYRSHFRATLRQPEHLETLIKSLRLSFTTEGILKAREIENRLLTETWLSNEYNLLPKLHQLSIPTLIIHGDYDHIPVECAEHVAQAIPGARFALLKDCGHFSYLECPDQVRKELVDFFHMSNVNC